MSRWVLVTGSAKRIGRAIALNLAAAGYGIIVHYHRSAAEAEQLAGQIRTMGREACLAEIDLSNGKLVANLIPSLTEAIGPLTAIVNNASLFLPDAHQADNGQHMAVNADAPRLLSEAFHKSLPAGQKGSIINLLDADPTKPAFTAYNKSKIALADMTVAMAKSKAPQIRVNGVALGAVLPSPRESAEHFENLIQSSPLRVQVSPEAVAATVRFLLDNDFVTGEVVHVDSGAHLTHAERRG